MTSTTEPKPSAEPRPKPRPMPGPSICQACHRTGQKLEERWCGGHLLKLCVDHGNCLRHFPKET